MAVKRNNSEVYDLMENLIDVLGAEEVLRGINIVMNTYDFAQALEDVAEDNDIEVNEDGSLNF